MIDAKQSMTSKLDKYVTRLLRSFVIQRTQTVTLRDEADFIQKLYDYTYTQHRLKPTTLFCSIKITNYSTLDTHENLIDTVTYFLTDNSVNYAIGHVPISIVKNLLQLFLYNNLFSYNNKLYRFIKGSPSTLALSDLLSNIYLCVWQKSILKEVERHREFFGR